MSTILFPTSLPDQMFIDAARHYTRRCEGQAVWRIALTLADGSKRKIDVPRVVAEDHDDDFPPADGWDYRGDEFACGGEIFHVGGKAAKVLRVLIDAVGELVQLDDLKKLVWDKWTDKRTVQNSVSRLRQALRYCLDVLKWDFVRALTTPLQPPYFARLGVADALAKAAVEV